MAGSVQLRYPNYSLVEKASLCEAIKACRVIGGFPVTPSMISSVPAKIPS